MTDDVNMKWRDFGGCTIVTVPGDVDARQVDEIRDSAAVASGHMVLDIGAANLVHPSAASALAALHRKAYARGGSVRIVTKQVDVRSQVNEAAAGFAPPFYDEIGDALEASMAARQESLRVRT